MLIEQNRRNALLERDCLSQENASKLHQFFIFLDDELFRAPHYKHFFGIVLFLSLEVFA